MQRFRTGALLACLWYLSSPALGQTTVSLSPSKDNTLIEDPAGSLSNGSGPGFFCGRIDLGTLRRPVIAFDVAGVIPAGATITSATLKLRMSQTTAGPGDCALHLALADWGEGASSTGGGAGAPSTMGDATWIHTFYPSSSWTTVGGDFAATSSATISVDQAGLYEWSSAGVTTDVQGWLDAPSSNFGWVLVGEESGGKSAKRFDSREHPFAPNRPILEVTYSASAKVPAAALPATAALVAALALAGAAALRKRAR